MKNKLKIELEKKIIYIPNKIINIVVTRKKTSYKDTFLFTIPPI